MRWPAFWVFWLVFIQMRCERSRTGERPITVTKKKSPATWPYFIPSPQMTFRVTAIMAATGEFVCVCVGVKERRNTCNDIRKSSDTNPPPSSDSLGHRACRDSAEVTGIWASNGERGTEQDGAGRSRTGGSLNIQTEWARSSWPQITSLPPRDRSSWQRLRCFEVFSTTL